LGARESERGSSRGLRTGRTRRCPDAADPHPAGGLMPPAAVRASGARGAAPEGHGKAFKSPPPSGRYRGAEGRPSLLRGLGRTEPVTGAAPRGWRLRRRGRVGKSDTPNGGTAMRGRHTDPNLGRAGKSSPRLEALEDRTCPSSVSLNWHTLLISGDNTANVVTVLDGGH